MNRAQRRSIAKRDKKKAQQLLDHINSETQKGRTVDGDLFDHPPEDGKVCYSIEMDEASLNWNASLDEALHLITFIDAAVSHVTDYEEKRSQIRETVRHMLNQNKHLRTQGGNALAGCVLWLMRGNPQIWPLIESGRLKAAGYTIINQGNGDYIFRLSAN